MNCADKTEPTFTCDMCHGTFEFEWSDEEAQAELKEMFPDLEPSQCSVVCDDCYQRLMS